MKFIGLAICIGFIMISVASADTLIWDVPSGTVDGYKVYYGTNSSNLNNTLDVGNVTQCDLNTLPLSQNTQYYLTVTAYNTAGESNPCTPLAYTPADTTPPAPPVGLVAQ